MHNRKTSISLKRKKIIQKEKRHSSVFWKAFQISRKYFSCQRHFNENPSMRALAKILRAWASEHSSNFCEQFEQRPNFASTFQLNGTNRYPYCYQVISSLPIILVYLLSPLCSNYKVLTEISDLLYTFLWKASSWKGAPVYSVFLHAWITLLTPNIDSHLGWYFSSSGCFWLRKLVL